MTVDRGKILLSNLTNTLVVLIESINDSNSDNKETVLHEANILLDVIESASNDVGKYDIRYVRGSGLSLCKLIDTFYAIVTAWDMTRNQNRSKSLLKLFLKSFEPLSETLAMEWNSELDKPDDINEPGKTTENTPKKDNNSRDPPQRIFEKFSPLTRPVEVINCELCTATFTNPDSKKNHYRKKHPGIPVPAIIQYTGTCKLKSKNYPSERCGGQFSTSQINRHLQDVHKCEIKKGEFLRGFISSDGGLSYSALFLRKSDPDPEVDAIWLEDVPEEYTESRDEAVEIIIHGDEETIKKNLFPEDQEEKQNQKVDDEVEKRANATSLIVIENNQFPSSGENVGIDFPEVEQEETRDHVENRMEINEDENVSSDIDKLSKEEGKPNTETESVDSGDSSGSKSSPFHGFSSQEEANRVAFSHQLEKFSMMIDNEEEIDYRFCSQNSSQFESSRSSKNINCQMKKQVIISLWNEAVEDITDINEDSDSEENDPEAMKKKRISRKTARWSRRNSLEDQVSAPHEDPKNVKVIEDLQAYLLMRTTGGDKCSTVSKVLGHICFYPDSYLQHETDKDRNFKLEMNLNFGASDYRDIKFPLDWIKETTSEDPSRVVEKLKAHSRFRQYLKYKCGNSNLPSSEKHVIVELLDGISKEITAQNLYNKYSIEVNNESVESKRARMTLDPDMAQKVAKAVKAWNNSEIQKEIQKDMTQLYEETLKKKSLNADAITNRKFTQFSHWVRFNLILSDKNRPSCYKFRNIDLISNAEVWFPEGCDFASIPPNWNIHVRPSPDTPPSATLLSLPASLKSMKGQKPIDCVVTPYSMEWIQRYRDLKEIVFYDKEADPNDEFFINYKGNKLSDSDTLWAKFESVTGVTKSNVTSVRQGMEAMIRESENMTSQIKALNNHSNDIGKSNYNVTGYQHRCQFVAGAAIKENQTAPPEASVDADLLEEMRNNRRAQDEKLARQNALDVINRNKARKQQVMSHVKPPERVFMQEQLTSASNPEKEKITGSKFPVDRQWTFLLYKFIDGADLQEVVLRRVLEIESSIFRRIKAEVIEDSGREWTGDRIQNKMADLKIALSLKSSFYNYEKSKSAGSRSYFKF